MQKNLNVQRRGVVTARRRVIIIAQAAARRQHGEIQILYSTPASEDCLNDSRARVADVLETPIGGLSRMSDLSVRSAA
jgi:hypothetical protein